MKEKLDKIFSRAMGVPTKEEMKKEIEEEKRKKEEEEKEFRRERAKRRREEKKWLDNKLKEKNISQEQWNLLSKQERNHQKFLWREEEGPEEVEKRELEKRLETLIGKRVMGFEVDSSATVEIKLEDGSTLSFRSWDGYDDKADFDGVEVSPPEKEKEEGERPPEKEEKEETDKP